MRLAGSDDFKIELMKGAADDPALVSLADLGSQSYSPTALNADDYYYGFRRPSSSPTASNTTVSSVKGYREQLDDDLGQLSARFVANKEKEKEEKVTVKPVKKKTVDEQIKEDILKRHGLEGSYEDNADVLAQQMKYNPASTTLDWKQAFGQCDAFGCYWPDETDPGDYYNVGGGGRKSAPSGRSTSNKSNVSGRKTNTKTNRRGHNSAGSGMSNKSRNKARSKSKK